MDGKAQTVDSPVRPDPRVKTDLSAQTQFAAKIQIDFSKLAGTVQQIRAIRKQFLDRNELISVNDKTKDLVRASKELVGKLDALEEKLHNPKAQVTYDIFGPKGGAPAVLAIRVPIRDGQRGRRPADSRDAASVRRTGRGAGQIDRRFPTLAAGDLVKLNATAKELDLPVVIVPPVKTGDETEGIKVRRRD